MRVADRLVRLRLILLRSLRNTVIHVLSRLDSGHIRALNHAENTNRQHVLVRVHILRNARHRRTGLIKRAGTHRRIANRLNNLFSVINNANHRLTGSRFLNHATTTMSNGLIRSLLTYHRRTLILLSLRNVTGDATHTQRSNSLNGQHKALLTNDSSNVASLIMKGSLLLVIKGRHKLTLLTNSSGLRQLLGIILNYALTALTGNTRNTLISSVNRINTQNAEHNTNGHNRVSQQLNLRALNIGLRSILATNRVKRLSKSTTIGAAKTR